MQAAGDGSSGRRPEPRSAAGRRPRDRWRRAPSPGAAAVRL